MHAETIAVHEQFGRYLCLSEFQNFPTGSAHFHLVFCHCFWHNWNRDRLRWRHWFYRIISKETWHIAIKISRPNNWSMLFWRVQKLWWVRWTKHDWDLDLIGGNFVIDCVNTVSTIKANNTISAIAMILSNWNIIRVVVMLTQIDFAIYFSNMMTSFVSFASRYYLHFFSTLFPLLLGIIIWTQRQTVRFCLVLPWNRPPKLVDR